MKAIISFIIFISLSVNAQKIYVPVGAPMNPKVDVKWNVFHTVKEVGEILQKLAKAHPEYAKLISLGKSYNKHDMWLMTITAPGGLKASEKPAFWIDGGIHANEIQSVEVPLYTAWYLLEMKEQSPIIKKLLQERTFYIMPMLSPDSRDEHMKNPNTTHTPRTGQRPIDDDKDGLIDEDGFDDIDKDGSITLMRKKDPEGLFKEDPKRPGLMMRVAPGEKGQYTLLGTEGIDNDGDGRVNEDGNGSYDPNRNWPWNWQPPYIQRGSHNYPLSIPEVRMTADAIIARPNIAGAQTYHNCGGMLLMGPGHKDDAYHKNDNSTYQKLASTGLRILPGYKITVVHKDLYTVYGGELDWFHKMRGVFCFNNELFTPYNLFHDENSHFMPNQTDMYDFDKLLLFNDGIAPWKEVDHPQYGKIEVGGFKKNWKRQPPSFMLEEECHRNMAFTLHHADQMALVKIASVKTNKVKDGVYEVTVLLENNKVCPTHTQEDLKYKISPPNLLKLSGEKVKVLTTFHSQDSQFRHSQEQKKNPGSAKINIIAAQGRAFVRYLVQGQGKFKVAFKSIKSGRDSYEGNLE